MRGSSLYDEARRQGKLWTPRELGSSVRLWIDAAAPVRTLDTSARIVSWVDVQGVQTVSGDGATGTNRPLWNLVAYAPAGGNAVQPTVTFSGSTAQFLTLGSSISYSGSDGLTVVAVSERCNARSVGTIVGHNNGGPQFRWNTSAGTVEGLRAAQASLITSTATAATTGLHIVSARFATNYCEVSVNGTRNSNTTNPGFTNPIIAIGSRNSGAGDESMAGGISAVVICNRILSLADLARVEGALAWQYGRQNSFAISHPYRNDPPLVGDIALYQRRPFIYWVPALTTPTSSRRRLIII